jgi:hypothetical protein
LVRRRKGHQLSLGRRSIRMSAKIFAVEG